MNILMPSAALTLTCSRRPPSSLISSVLVVAAEGAGSPSKLVQLDYVRIDIVWACFRGAGWAFTDQA